MISHYKDKMVKLKINKLLIIINKVINNKDHILIKLRICQTTNHKLLNNIRKVINTMISVYNL